MKGCSFWLINSYIFLIKFHCKTHVSWRIMVAGNMGFYVYGKRNFLVKGVSDYGNELCKNCGKMGNPEVAVKGPKEGNPFCDQWIKGTFECKMRRKQ